MEKHDLTLEAAAISAASRAVEPYEDELRELKKEIAGFRSETERRIAEVISLKAEVQQLKESAERIARYASEDRDRLAAKVKEESGSQAEAKAREIVKQTLLNLGIDIDKSADFIARMRDLDKFIEAIDSTKKTSAKVIIGSIVAGAIAIFWTAVKGSLLKP